MAKLGEANVGGRLVPAWLLNLTAEELDSLKSLWYSNPNLLDNWYFGNPLNQRGISSQNPWPSNAYGIDRWILYGSNASLENGYILFPAGTVPTQVLEPSLYNSLAGKVATFSYLTNDGNLVTGTATITKGATILFVNNSEGQSYINESGGLQFYRNVGFGCIAAKLELGDQQTLAHRENGAWVLNEIPDYTEELLKCMTSKADSADTYANCELSPKMNDLGEYDGYKSIDKYNGLPVVYKNAKGFLLWGTGSKGASDGYFDSMGRAIRFSASAGGSVTIPLLPNRVYLVSSSNNVGHCLAVVLTAGRVVSSISHLLQASGVSISVGSGLSIVVTDTHGQYGRTVSVMML